MAFVTVPASGPAGWDNRDIWKCSGFIFLFRFAAPNVPTAILHPAFSQPAITIATSRVSSRTSAPHASVRRSGALILPQAVDSIYLGGGTPSLLSPALFRRLFTSLRREFAVLPTAEITVECAPGQLEPAALEALAECGVTRVSFGVQSFVDSEAKSIGRLHNRAVALEDIRRVQAAGIHDVSVDLIAGLPGQTLDSWYESLSALAESGVDHASIYMLEVDDESRLGRELLVNGGRYRAKEVPGDDLIAELYTEAIAYLWQGTAWPSTRFPISPVPASESQHNLKYWRRHPYLGFGLDAHSMIRTHAGAALRFGTTDDFDAVPWGSGLERAAPPGSRGADGRGLVPGLAAE